MALSEQALRLFEELSGWVRKEQFEHQHAGYIVMELDVTTDRRNLAFLWRLHDEDHVHEFVQSMVLDGQLFFKKERKTV